MVNKEHRVCAPESNQSPTREEPGGASCSEELRRSRSFYECARVFGVARPRPEGSAVALLQNVSNSFFPVTSLGIGEVPGFSVHYLYHDVPLFIDPEFTEISLVSFQDAAFLLLHRPFFHFAPPHIGGGLPT